MTRLGKFEKAVEFVQEEIQEKGDTSTLIVGSMGMGKDFSVMHPNILLEEEKNIVVIDPWDEISDFHLFKEKQGYKILKYNLEYIGIQQIQADVSQFIDKKVFIHVIFPEDRNNGKCVYEFLEFMKEVQEKEWKNEKQLHIFLKNFEKYEFPEFREVIKIWRKYKISITMSVASVLEVDDAIDKDILNNFDYVIYKRIRNPQTAERIADWLKCYQVDYTGKFFGANVLLIPLEAGKIRDMPLGWGLLHTRFGGSKFVETYNTEEILGRPVNHSSPTNTITIEFVEAIDYKKIAEKVGGKIINIQLENGTKINPLE